MKKWLFCIGLLLLLMSGGCSRPQTVDIYGNVNFITAPEAITTLSYRDGQDQALVLIDGGAGRVLTDFNGQFVVKNVLPGKHTLKVQDAYYLSDEVQITAQSDMEVNLEAWLEYWFPVFSWINGLDGQVVAKGSGNLKTVHPEADRLEISIDGLSTAPVIVESKKYFQVNVPFENAEANRDYVMELQFSQAGQVVETRQRKLRFACPEKYPVELSEAGIKFSWGGECGPYAQYKISLSSEDNKVNRQYTTSLSPYTAINDLPPGKYNWRLKTLVYDVAGKIQSYIITNGQEFTIPE